MASDSSTIACKIIENLTENQYFAFGLHSGNKELQDGSRFSQDGRKKLQDGRRWPQDALLDPP